MSNMENKASDQIDAGLSERGNLLNRIQELERSLDAERITKNILRDTHEKLEQKLGDMRSQRDLSDERVIELEQRLAESEKKVQEKIQINQSEALLNTSLSRENKKLEQKLSEALEVIQEIKKLEIYDFSPVEKYQTKIRNIISLFLGKHEVKDE